MADKKFVNLHESYMRRYERGGFLVGDVFKFNDNFKSTECYKALGAKKDIDSFYIQEKTTATYGEGDQSYTQDYLYAPKNGEGVHQPKISVEYWGTNVHLEDKTKKKKSDEETVEDDDSDIEIESDEEVSTSKWIIAWNNAKNETELKMFKNMLK